MKKIALILLSIISVSCNSTKTLKINTIHGIEITEITNTGIAFTVRLDAENQFKSKITIKSAEFDIVNNNKAIAKINLENPVIFAPTTQQEYQIHGRARMGQRSTLEIIENFTKMTSVTIQGKVHIKKGGFGKKIKFEQTLTQQQLIDIVKQLRN